jgi:AbrB family looped-hinge helix DNA binding protein
MATTNQENKEMMVRLLRGGQVTVPASLRKQLKVREGDYLEAEMVGGSLMLKPVTVIDREAAWEAIREAQGSVRYIGPEPRPSPEEEEEQIYEIVREHRERHG